MRAVRGVGRGERVRGGDGRSRSGGDDGGVGPAAAAALEKPKEKEKRISTMNEAQIMEKLRSVVSKDDPKALYSKIKKIGQGYVRIFIS